MMVMDRKSGEIQHKIFKELPLFLEPGDLLVVNNSKVLPARLLGTKEGGGASCEILLLREREKDVWECLAKPGKRLKEGARVVTRDLVFDCGNPRDTGRRK